MSCWWTILSCVEPRLNKSWIWHVLPGLKKCILLLPRRKFDYPNVYGIDMPTSSELIAFGRDTDEVAKLIGVDKLIFQDLADLTGAVQQENPSIKEFDCSVFTGCYVTGDISEDYLEQIAVQRNDTAKKKREKDSSNLEMYNER